ncbi:MAG: hypothetical protein ACI83N_001146, partial [Hydrogenophaga sp.]
MRSLTTRHLLHTRLCSAALLLSLAACGGGGDATPVAPAPEQTPRLLTLEKIGGFAHSGGASSAEITAYDPLSKRLF